MIRAMELRGSSFKETYRTLRTLLRSLPHPAAPGQKRLRLAVMNCGAPAPGMNTAVRAAVRIGLDRGHIMLGIANGFKGFIDGEVHEMNWMSVSGWASKGGSGLGTSREIPSGRDFYAIARTIEKYDIHGLLMIGGFSGYQGAHHLLCRARKLSGFQHPDHLSARVDQQQPARLRSEHRRGHGAEHDRGSGGQSQAGGGGAAALLRGGSDGPQVRLSGVDERPGDRRGTRVPARRRRAPARSGRPMWSSCGWALSTASGWA